MNNKSLKRKQDALKQAQTELQDHVKLVELGFNLQNEVAKYQKQVDQLTDDLTEVYKKIIKRAS